MNIELYPLGTGWDLVQTKARPACFGFVGGSTPAEMSERHRFVGGSFTAKSLTEIQEKVNLAVNAGLPESVAPVGVTASLETARSSSSSKEVYAFVGVFISEDAELVEPSGGPSPVQAECAAAGSGLSGFQGRCGTHFIGKRAWGDWVVIYTTPDAISGAEAAFRTAFNTVAPQAQVDLAQAITALGGALPPNSLQFSTGSLGAPSAADPALGITASDVLTWVGEVTASSRTRSAERRSTSPGLNPFGTQLYSELSPHKLAAIEACVGPVGLTESRYTCLMEALEQLLSLKSESGSFSLVRDAVARANRLRNGQYIYGRLPQEVCDLIGSGDNDGDPHSEDCGKEAVDGLPSMVEACRASLSQATVDRCIAAIQAGEQCDRVERVKPADCEMPAACTAVIELALGVSTLPATPASTAPPNIVSGTLDEQVVVGTTNGAPVISRHSEKTHLCMPTEVAGRIHSEHGNSGSVRTHIDPGTGRWAFSVQTTGENADRTRVVFRCVAKAEFGPRSWALIEGGNVDWSVLPATWNPVIVGGVAVPFYLYVNDYSDDVAGTASTKFLHALSGFSGTFEDPWTQVGTDRQALSPARWEARAYGWAQVSLTTHAITASPFFSSHLDTDWVQTDGARSIRTTFDTGLEVGDGFCYLNGLRGEFARASDGVRLLPHRNAADTADTWHLWVTAGFNLADKRDVWGRAQCIRFR